MVTALVSVSGLSLVASADLGSTIIEVLLGKAIETAFNSGNLSEVFGNQFTTTPNNPQEAWNLMDSETRDLVLQRYYNYMQSTGQFNHESDPSSWAADLKPIEFYLNMAATYCNAPTPTAGNYHYMIWAMSYSGYYQVNVRLIYDTNHYNDWNYYLNYYNQPCVTRANNATFDCIYAQIPDNTMFGGNACSVANGGYYTNSRGCDTNQDMDSPYVYCYATDMVDSPLRFSAQFFVTENNQLNIFLDSNRPVTDDLKAVAGILYDDGTHVYNGSDRGYINADYIGTRTLAGSQHWEWGFDLSNFTNWAYKNKVLDTDNFYAFVHVLDGSTIVYADQQHLDLGLPNGIFDNTTALPDWHDYVNLPTIGLSTLPSTFDYSPTTYQTINNYNGTDFDFPSFFDWYEDAFTALANNTNAFFANAQAFMGAFADFNINGIVNGFANIGSLIDDLNLNLTNNVNNLGDYLGNLGKSIDFNNKMLIDNINTDIKNSFGGLTTQFGDFDLSLNNYCTDLSNTINNNTDTIVNNINNLIEAQLVPDKTYVNWLVLMALPWYAQIRDALNNVSYNNSAFELTINFGQVLGEHTMVFDNVELATKIRSVLSMILIGSTVAGCARIGFQMLGIDVSKGKGGE